MNDRKWTWKKLTQPGAEKFSPEKPELRPRICELNLHSGSL